MSKRCLYLFLTEAGIRNIGYSEDPRKSYALWWCKEFTEQSQEYKTDLNCKRFVPQFLEISCDETNEWNRKKISKEDLDNLTICWMDECGFCSCGFLFDKGQVYGTEEIIPYLSESRIIRHQLKQYLSDVSSFSIKRLKEIIFLEDW